MRTSINFFSEKTLRIIFASLFIVFCSSAYSESKTKTFLTQSKLVKLTFPSGHYKNTDDNPYDLQVFSKYMKESTGVFEFLASDLAEDFQAKDIFAMQIADIRSINDKCLNSALRISSPVLLRRSRTVNISIKTSIVQTCVGTICPLDGCFSSKQI